MRIFMLCLIATFVTAFVTRLDAVDWPTYRGDAARTGSTEAEIIDSAQLVWKRQLPKLDMAWHFEKRLQFDRSYEPIVVGDLLILAINNFDKVVAYDLQTGGEKWSFFANGPVRLAPVAYKNKLFFGSDDGNFYCVETKTGKLLHTLDCNPDKRMLLGNNRYISNMPVRGGAVLDGNIIYFTAGVWPVEGVAIYAINADTFKTKWVNNTAHLQMIPHAHGSMAYGGIAPQGYSAVMGDTLFVANGRARPARLDKHTGELLDYDTGWYGGSWHVCGTDTYYINGGKIFNTKNGFLSQNLDVQKNPSNQGGVQISENKSFKLAFPVIDGDKIYIARGGIGEWDATSIQLKWEVSYKVRYDYEHKQYVGKVSDKQLLDNKKIERVWLAGKNALISSTDTSLLCTDKRGTQKWSLDIGGKAGAVIAVDNYVVLITEDHSLQVLSKNGSGSTIETKKASLASRGSAKSLLKAAGQNEGYCMVLGVKSPQLIADIVSDSDLRVIAVDKDVRKMNTLRQQLQDAGAYGIHASVICQDPADLVLSEYMCNLILVHKNDIIADQNDLARIWTAVRPFGGVLVIPSSQADLMKSLKDDQAKVEIKGKYAYVTKEGRLKGAAPWTHEWGTAGNTMSTEDDRVFAPLGVMWYGGDADSYMFTDRHRGAPRPLVIEGRVMLTIPHRLYAYDAYTGRVLWDYPFPGYAGNFDTEWRYNPHASYQLGGSIAAIDGSLYLHNGNEIHELDPKTGTLKRKISKGLNKSVGHIVCYKDYLICLTESYGPASSYDESMFPDGKAAKSLIARLEGEMKQHTFPKRKTGESDGAYVAQMLNSLLETYYKYNKYPKYIPPANGKNLRNEAKNKNKMMEIAFRDKSISKEVLESRMRSSNLTFLGLWFDEVPQYAEAGNNTYEHASAGKITVFDRHSAKVIWERPADLGYRHAAVCVGSDKVFCIDLVPPHVAQKYKRLGKAPAETGKVYALDLKSGKAVWQQETTATALAYSELHDNLVESYSKGTLGKKESRPAIIRKGIDGSQRFTVKGAPAGNGVVMAGDYISVGYWATDAKTGNNAGWMVRRDRGCNPSIGSPHLLTFRSSAAGAYDLKNKTGTINFGGVRTDCSGSMIPAEGLINMPKMDAGCICNYPSQCSMALVNRSQNFHYFYAGVQRNYNHYGVNLAAIGDLKDEQGFNWYEFPFQGGKNTAQTFLRANHKRGKYPTISFTGEAQSKMCAASELSGDNAMIASSWSVGMDAVTLYSGQGFKGNVDLRLYFVEPEAGKKGQRVFTMSINGEETFKDFDIYKEAGAKKVLMKEIKGIQFKDKELVLAFNKASTSKYEPLLCGFEVVAAK